MRHASAGFARGEHGQAIVLVALSLIVVLAALALALDGGYGLAQRRVLQNASDAAALAVGRYLATSVLSVNGAPAFAVLGEEAWCVARVYISANSSFLAPDRTQSFTVQFGSSGSPTTWTTAQAPAAGTCPPTGGAQVIPSDTIYVRVRTESSYRSLVAATIGRPTLTAAASARVRLSGTAVPLSGPTWPMVRHYNPDDYEISCPPTSCNPTTVEPLTFWSPNESDVVYGQFKGLYDMSRNSSRFDPTIVRQLITDWDQSGSLSASPPTVPKPDMSGNCGGTWDTAGGEDPQNQNKQCSLPNWFYYAFSGTVALDGSWSTLPTGQEAPSALGGRAVCSSPPDPAPSCADASLGDWIETAYGNVGQNMSDNMLRRIQERGYVGPFSDQTVPNGPNKGNAYGKALTVLVYLWECAETYDSSAAAGSQWTLIFPPGGSTDCSQLSNGAGTSTPDRVHLFTAAPFTFYEGLVTSSAIQGYWGGVFGSPTSCRSCGLNALANTAFLVPDE